MDKEELLSKIEKIEKELQKLKLELQEEKPRAEEPRKPKKGDLVKILNPKAGQDKIGRIIRIGKETGFVTINTKKGKVVRSERNIRIIKEETK
mmetsp:Transcript_14386/g.27031  ORF Transcript_14386/g.27031 Transcript_14386/m.27031 type:complete len:93 (+) Transcript_14386:192-470(+)